MQKGFIYAGNEGRACPEHSEGCPLPELIINLYRRLDYDGLPHE